MILGGSVRLIFLRTSTPPGFVCPEQIEDVEGLPSIAGIFRCTKTECCTCDFSSISNVISLIFTASHEQSLVVCNDFSYNSKVVLLPRLMDAFRRTTIRPQFFQIFRLYVRSYAQMLLLSPFRTTNLRVAKRKLGVSVDSVPLKTGLAMFARVPHCQRFNGCLNPCRIHSTLCPNHVDHVDC